MKVSGVAQSVWTALIGSSIASTVHDSHLLPSYACAAIAGALRQHIAVIMPWMEADLDSLIVRKLLSPMQQWQSLCSAAAGVARLHSFGISHNDVKPENILVKGSSFVLCDFGCCSYLSDHALLRQGGTLPFLAPEICRFQSPPCEQSDCWSLAVLGFEIFACLQFTDTDSEGWIEAARPHLGLLPLGVRSFVTSCAVVSHELRWSAQTCLDYLKTIGPV